jgi:MHS family proline/betaine transporter-like MFS transporter
MSFFNQGKFTFPAVIGNVLEWYEFSLYGYFAHHISDVFFPEDSPTLAIIETFSVFALSYIVRPFGALLFGFFADRIGRTKILSVTIILMAVATSMIGLIPPYRVIGGFSVALLILCRLIQGIALGGEYSSAVVYLLEQSPLKRQGFWGGTFCSAGYLGFLLGSSAHILVTHLSPQLGENIWRIPFILSLFLGILGVYIRKKMPESSEFIETKEKFPQIKNPLLSLIRDHRPSLFKAMGLTILPAITSYLFLIYVPIYIKLFGTIEYKTSLFLNTSAVLLAIILLPLLGSISDLIGRFYMIFGSAILLLILSPFLLPLLLTDNIILVTTALYSFVILLCSIEALIPTMLIHLFPVNNRCSGVAISFNLTSGIFGGTTPLIATLLIVKTGSLNAPSWYLMCSSILCLTAAILIKKYNPRSYDVEPKY